MQSPQSELNTLRKQIEDNLVCELKDAATNMVFGKGNPQAKIVFIGEAPGAEEDKLGVPFVGRAGQELDKLLGKIGLTLDDVYICNILKYRPPKNRDPTMGEICNHTPYLIKQLKIIQPKVIVTLGNYSTKFVLSGFDPEEMRKVQGITTLHGKKHSLLVDGVEFLVIPMYHPAAMLYNPKLRELVEKDFLIMAKLLDLEAKPEAGGQGTLEGFL
ncbi:uracil-DNA glycosylase [Candidatus Woesearchaeota archaeon]|nr:uracil-DNA glycosylase [Candidatus Woesearchaeota archaeon]